MTKSIRANTKSAKRGRPVTTGKGTLVGVRLQPDKLAALDQWRLEQPSKPSRPEAIRGMIDAVLHMLNK